MREGYRRKVKRKWGNLAIRDKARTLLEDAGLLDEPEFFRPDFDKVLEKLGFEYLEFDPNEEIQHISGVVNHDRRHIIVNRTEPPERRLFTLAHEIGHVALHPGENAIDFRRRVAQWDHLEDEALRKEHEADIFAYELLMPFEPFVIAYLETDGDINAMARRFYVSPQDIADRVDFIERQVSEGYVPKASLGSSDPP